MTKSISGRSGQFAYFDHQIGGPDWTGKQVLDFGGKAGNMLLDPNSGIEQRDYWCIDASGGAITEGRRRYPDAHFVFYDRYNYKFNPTGTVGLPIPDPGVRFDVIVSFSMISYNKAETLNIIDQLTALLAEDGILAFSFLDPLWTPPPEWPYPSESAVSAHWAQVYRSLEVNYAEKLNMSLDEVLMRAKKTALESASAGWSNLREYLEKAHVVNPELDVAGLYRQISDTSLTWVELIDCSKLVVDSAYAASTAEIVQNPVHLPLWANVSFCAAEYLTQLLPDAQIRPPAQSERLHCAIIDGRNGAGRQ
jgi:SAM-dependent methyltransferase